MSIVTTLVRANYQVVRAPVDLFRRKVLNRFPGDSLVRLSADGTIGLLDAVIGRITGDDEMRERGGAMAKDVIDSLQARAPRLNLSPGSALTPPAPQPEPFRTQYPGPTDIEIDPYMGT